MRRHVPLIVAVFLAATLPATACENAVRDAAFRGPRDVHRLCLITATDDADARKEHQRLSAWLDGPAAGLNLELVHLRADDPDVAWTDYGIPSAPPVLPVVALIGKNYGTGENFVIDHWEPAPTDDDLAIVLNSPARRRLQQTLGQSLAVILVAPGEEYDAQKFDNIFAAVQSTWLLKELPPVEVIELDRRDENERTLAGFMALPPGGPSVVGVVFGRGKLMSPPLIGPEISRKGINELIDQVYQDCNCSQPLPSIGVDLPLVWNDELAKTFIPVSDPAPKSADPRLEQLPGVADFTAANDQPPSSPPPSRETEASDQAPVAVETTSTNQVMRVTIAALCGVAVALAAASWIVFRKRPS